MKMKALSENRFFRQLSTLPLWLMLTGCVGTFQDVKPSVWGSPPATRPQTLVVGTINITDARVTPAQSDFYLDHLREGVRSWCAGQHAFTDVILNAPSPVPETAIVLTGHISEVEPGSKSARFWVGMGAGQARIQGEFSIRDSMGKPLCTFSANRTYLGGSGIGGWDMMPFEDLFTKLGAGLAETTDKWLKGEKLE